MLLTFNLQIVEPYVNQYLLNSALRYLAARGSKQILCFLVFISVKLPTSPQTAYPTPQGQGGGCDIRHTALSLFLSVP